MPCGTEIVEHDQVILNLPVRYAKTFKFLVVPSSSFVRPFCGMILEDHLET